MYSPQKQWVCIISILYLLDLALCFELILERSEIVYMNPEACEGSASIKRINRTTVAMNISGHILQDIPSDARIQIDIFGFYSNTYRKLALNIQRNICSMFDYEYKFVQNDIKGHYPEKCPIKKGYYYVRNYVPNTKYFPASPWTASKYYVEITMFYKEIIQFQSRVYARVERNPLDRSKK